MTKSLRVLMLLTDGFGGVGGIAKFNRDFLQALDSCALVERVHAKPRLIPAPIEEVIPESVVYDRRAARGKVAFMLRLAAHVWRVRPVDLLICGHLRLLPAAWLLARLRGARLALIIHGLEAWEPSRKLWRTDWQGPWMPSFRSAIFRRKDLPAGPRYLWIGPLSCRIVWISTISNPGNAI